jgi:hypothetical protein
MRVFWVLLIFLFSSSGGCLSCHAQLKEEIESLPVSSRKLRALAEQCVVLYDKHGHVGICLNDLRGEAIGDISLFPNEQYSLSRFDRLFFKKGDSPQRVGEENLVLFLVKPGERGNLSSIRWQVYVESTYHHINNIAATARGEAPCYRKEAHQTVFLTTLVKKLCSKSDAPVSAEFWYHVYDRFLASRGGKRLEELLTWFVKEIDSTKDILGPKTQQLEPQEKEC